MIVTCTPSGPVWPRLIQHELLVVLEFDKYFHWWSSKAKVNTIWITSSFKSLINIITDDSDLYTIWSSETKVNTTWSTSSFRVW